MHHFDYKNGVLHAEDVALPLIAEAVGTPFYCYSSATLSRHYTIFADAFSDIDALVCYAMKANSNQAVLKTLAKLGKELGGLRGRLKNPKFAASAPPEVVEETKANLALREEEDTKLTGALNRLKELG